MEFEEALIAELDSITELAGKAFPLVAQKKDVAGRTVTAPYAIFSSSDGLRGKTLGGYLSSKSIDVELNVIAATYRQMKELSAQLMPLLIGFEQRIIGTDGPFIQELSYDEPDEIFEPQVNLCRWNITFKVYI